MVATLETNEQPTDSPLDNPRRENFARAIAAGLPLAEAWKKAGYSCRYNKRAQEANACKLRREPDVAARILEIHQAAKHKDALTMQERRLALAAIVRTPATRFLRIDWSDESEVLKLGPAVQAIKGIRTKSYANDAGHTVAETDLDLYDKIAAIREDAILAGERRTDGAHVSVSVAVDARSVIAAIRGGPGPSGNPDMAADVRPGSGPAVLVAPDDATAMSGPSPVMDMAGPQPSSVSPGVAMVAVPVGPLGPLAVGVCGVVGAGYVPPSGVVLDE